jgi:hypothetical protein
MYSLYIKTHKKTGLKYLGQTKQDPYKYPGSGIVWSKHLKEHGNYQETEVILQTDDWKILKETGRYYSTLYNVVGAMNDFGDKIWANEIPETGAGPGWSSDQAKEIQNRPEVKALKMGKNNPYHRLDKVAHSKATSDAMNRPEIKEICSGANHHGFDHTIYDFVHDDGTVVSCTYFELRTKYKLHHGHIRLVIDGVRKSHKGWRVK